MYCLLNIGDNNADGKDELAFVVDLADFSQLNNCQIIAHCQGRWQSLKTFTINEDAFAVSAATTPAFTEIEGFLVRRGKRWVYNDYLQEMAAEEEHEPLRPLLLGRCD